METLEELKAIIAGKPSEEEVTHIDSDGTYWFMNPESQSMFYDHDGLNYCEPQEPLRSLSDIERIIELMEINSETQRQRASSSEAYGKFIDNMGRDHKLDLMLSNSIVNQCINLGHISGMSEVETLKSAIAAMIKLSDDDLKNKIDLAMRRVNPYPKGDL